MLLSLVHSQQNSQSHSTLWHMILVPSGTVLHKMIYRIFRPIARALSIQKRSKIVKKEHARYTLERFPTNNARVICTKKGIGKYNIMY
jgi:hypothetical protein